MNAQATLTNEAETVETVTVSTVRPKRAARKVPVPATVIVETAKVVRETPEHVKARRDRQFKAGAFVGSISVVLTAISISHLSTGIEAVTHCAAWEAWAMAIGIDLGFVGFKACDICAATVDAREANETYGKWAIIGTLILSAVLNGLTFSSGADSIGMKVAAVALGIAIPAMIFAAFKVSSAMLINNRK